MIRQLSYFLYQNVSRSDDITSEAYPDSPLFSTLTSPSLTRACSAAKPNTDEHQQRAKVLRILSATLQSEHYHSFHLTMRRRGTERLNCLPPDAVLIHENNMIQTGSRVYALVSQAPETRLASCWFSLLLLLARVAFENVNKIMLFLFLKLASGCPFHRESNCMVFILRLKSSPDMSLAPSLSVLHTTVCGRKGAAC